MVARFAFGFGSLRSRANFLLLLRVPSLRCCEDLPPLALSRSCSFSSCFSSTNPSSSLSPSAPSRRRVVVVVQNPGTAPCQILQHSSIRLKSDSASAAVRRERDQVALKELYPNSSLDVTEKIEVPRTEGLNFSGYIPIEDLQITYCRSSGPGGQHVNTTSSKVDLRFKLSSATWLSEELKEKLLEKQPNSVNKDGYFIVKSDKTRSQHLNLADCLDKLRKTIWESAKVPEPPSEESIERRRRLAEAAARRRLAEKRIRSTVKASRQNPAF